MALADSSAICLDETIGLAGRRSFMATTRVALIQMSCEASTEANLAKAVARIRDAAEAGAKLVCLPELFRAQYFCQREDHALFATAESIPGPSTAALSEVVREYKLTPDQYLRSTRLREWAGTSLR